MLNNQRMESAPASSDNKQVYLRSFLSFCGAPGSFLSAFILSLTLAADGSSTFTASHTQQPVGGVAALLKGTSTRRGIKPAASGLQQPPTRASLQVW